MYQIFRNGTGYFKVDIENLENKYNVRILYGKNIFSEIICKRFLLGVDIDEPENLGNSILLHIEDNSYLYIGATIYFFTSKSEILEYYSPVGNSCVPYPYGIDINGNYYLMKEEVVINLIVKNDDFDKNLTLNEIFGDNFDIYDVYYNYDSCEYNKYVDLETKSILNIDFLITLQTDMRPFYTPESECDSECDSIS